MKRGEKFVQTVDREGLLAYQKKTYPELYDLTVGHLFGDIWTRPHLNLRDRQLITLAANIALGRTTGNHSHYNSAMHIGITNEMGEGDQRGGYPRGAVLNAVARRRAPAWHFGQTRRMHMRCTIVVAVASSLLVSLQAFSQSPQDEAASFPTKRVRIIVPYAPGGGSDLLARPLAPKLTQLWGQQVMIDNRGGAAGIVGSAAAAKSPPDGYTLLVGLTPTHGIAQSLYRKIPYDTIKDFTPITMISFGPNILTVHPSVPVKSIKELIALARARPGEFNYGSPGSGTMPHLQMAIFNKLAKVKMMHVPYQAGGGPAVMALLSGEVQIAFTAATVGIPHIEAGKLRALGLSGAKKPSSAFLAAFPTVAESGVPDFDESTWYGMFGPAGLPPAILKKLNADIVKVLTSPDMKEYFASQGHEVVGDSPEHFREHVRAQVAKWAEVIKELGLQVD